MDILVVGSDKNFFELREKFGEEHNYTHLDSHLILSDNKGDVAFDFLADSFPENIGVYGSTEIDLIFCQSIFFSLSEIWNVSGKIDKNLIGFNGLPGFFNRNILEVSFLSSEDEELAETICKKLGTDYLKVEDRVGQVSPRVIVMIINEAYYTVQEGTATKNDIDIGMKLGTNYPKGPFEWLHEIGIENVYKILDALYKDTGDERYKICPLLKQEYLRSS